MVKKMNNIGEKKKKTKKSKREIRSQKVLKYGEIVDKFRNMIKVERFFKNKIDKLDKIRIKLTVMKKARNNEKIHNSCTHTH